MQTLFLFISIVLTYHTANSQVLSPEQLKSDFALFRTALQEVHPGLYRYNTKEHMDSLLAETENILLASMTREEFFRLLTPVVSEIKCGHTKFHPDENWTDNYFFNREKLFPLKVIFIDNKAYILGSWLPENIHISVGAELISINGTPVSDIKPRLMKGLYSDGNNETFKNIELGKFFSALYANLIGPSDNFEIKLSMGDQEQTLNLPSVTVKDILENNKAVIKSEPWSFRTMEGSTGILTISNFAEGSGKSFKRFLKESFGTMSKMEIRNLIIDVRNNEGGEDSRGSLLLSYLMNKPFRYYDHLEAVTDKKISFSEQAYTPKFYGILRMLVTRTDSGAILWKHHKNLKIQKPQKAHYDGKVYVLINGASFSVTSEFASVAHYLKRAVFIGEETGGGYYGNNSGTFIIAKLPNSRLNIGIPMLAYYTAVSNYPFAGHGVIPDYIIVEQIEDVIAKTDPIMEFTKQLISKHNL